MNKVSYFFSTGNCTIFLWMTRNRKLYVGYLCSVDLFWEFVQACWQCGGAKLYTIYISIEDALGFVQNIYFLNAHFDNGNL